MRSRPSLRAASSTGLGIYAVLALLLHLAGAQAAPVDVGRARRLTFDGQSRVVGWSPDGETILVNRWGEELGDGSIRQILSELWGIRLAHGDVTPLGSDAAILYSENALQATYSGDGRRIAYLAFVGDGRWEARVLDVVSGRDVSVGAADLRMAPTWIGAGLAYSRNAQVMLSDEGALGLASAFSLVSSGAQLRVSADGAHLAWSCGSQLWSAKVGDAGEEPRLLVADTRVLSFAWSPDGRRLAYVVEPTGLYPELWSVDINGNGPSVMLVRGQQELFSAPSWSPNGRLIALSRTPSGAATAAASDIWLADVEGRSAWPLIRNSLEESSPIWGPDGRQLAFNRAGDVWIVDSDLRHDSTRRNRIQSSAGQVLPETLPDHGSGPAPAAQLMPPDTIRVLHVQENEDYYGCRQGVPVGQIDVIGLEDYTRRVVPAEMPASWASEALKAQSVAVRTYGWKQVEQADPMAHYDVSDWTGDQLMCDSTHPSTDSAVAATQGQYVEWNDLLIYSIYSAENGSPTKTTYTDMFPNGVPYLLGVDDPVSFGQPVRGHGSGLSQWGAQRWADAHGWGYQQILAHYYTDATIEQAITGGPSPTGAVALPWSDFYVTANRIHVVANASDGQSAVEAVGFCVVSDTETLIMTDTVGQDGWSALWDVAMVSDTAAKSLTLSAVIVDTDGNTGGQGGSVQIGLDRRQPIYPAAASLGTYADSSTIILSSLSAVDPEPGSGLQTMAFSNDGWTWEGEDLLHQQDSGALVSDGDALNGQAWCGSSGMHSAGAWFGPYTSDLPPGYAYRAYFRLKTEDVATTSEVAMLDVVDDAGGRVLGLRRLRGTDFRAANVYQEFPVDFHYSDPGTAGLEFRTAFRAAAGLCLDRVLIVRYPVPFAPSAPWELSPGEGLKMVTAKFIDGAGNVSEDLTRTVTVDLNPPGAWEGFAPLWWTGGDAPTCTVRVLDEVSGLDVGSARYRFSTDGGASWSGWTAAECTGTSGTKQAQTLTAVTVAFEEPRAIDNRVWFEVSDVAGHVGSRSFTVRGRPAYLPLVLQE